MPNFELTLEGFKFPATLKDERCTFRFMIDLRYIDSNGKMATVHSVLPGLDTYWECEKDHAGKKEASFVRHDTLPEIDFGKVDDWDQLIVRMPATELHSLQVRVFDIEKDGGFLDKLRDYAGLVVEALIGKASSMATGAIPAPPAFLKEVFGSAVDDVEAYAISQIAGVKKQDALIFKKSAHKLASLPAGPIELTGIGAATTTTDYKVTINIAKS